MIRLQFSPTLLLLAFLIAGCERPTTHESSFSVRDSAGIEIVESSDPLLGPDAWTVSKDPVLQIGGQAEEPTHDFWRISRVLRLSNGQVLVANDGTKEIRFFDTKGGFLSSIGRDGEGPGEFRSIAGVFPLSGDSLVVLDGELDRVTTFDPTGTVAGTFNLPPLKDFLGMTLGGLLSDDELIWIGLRSFFTGQEIRVVKDSVPYLVSDREGLKWDTLGWFPDSDQYVISTPRFVSMERVPFRRQASRTVHGGQLYTGMGEPYEIRVSSRGGRLKRVIRRNLPPRQLTQDQIDKDWLPPSEEDPSRELRLEARRTFTYPSIIPFFTELIADRQGNLWVRRLTWPEKDDELWDVFDPSGRLLTNLRLPVGFGVHDIGEDYILGVWKDEFDVEYVRMYSLDRGG